MVVSRLLRSQIEKKHNELVEKLQAEAHMLFYDHMMYDINDSLTSILAVCEMDPKEAIPKVKQYIHRINQSLHDTKSYQINSYAEKKFNISIVLKNILRVIGENYKQIKLMPLLTDIKAPVQGDQSHFEQIILHAIVAILLQAGQDESELLIELRQKDQDAQLTILKDNCVFSSEVLERIRSISKKDDFSGSVQITPQGKGIEIIIRIPLQFRVVNIGNPVIKKTPPSLKPEVKKVATSRKEEVLLEYEEIERRIITPGMAF